MYTRILAVSSINVTKTCGCYNYDSLCSDNGRMRYGQSHRPSRSSFDTGDLWLRLGKSNSVLLCID